jgi:hypothetical protein
MKNATKTKNQNISLNTEKVNPSFFKGVELYYLFGLISILLLIIIIRSNYLTIPFERDEGAYSYSGQAILNGAIPFKDLGSQRLPGVFYCYALIVALFGYTLKSMHVAFICINLLSAILIYFTSRKLFNNVTALGASLFWALLSMNMSISGFTVQSEHLVAFFALGGIYSLLKYFDKKSYLWIIVSGLLFCLSFEVKQTSIFLGFFAGIMLVGRQFFVKDRNYKQILISTFLFAACIFVPVGIDLLIVFKRGGYEDFNYWFFDVRKEYTSVISFEQGLEYLGMNFNAMYQNYKFIWVLSFFGSITIFFTKAKWWLKIFVIGFYSFGFLTVMPGNHYYGHYFLQWVPTVCISASAFIYFVHELMKNKFNIQKSPQYIILAVLFLFSYSHLNALKKYYFNKNNFQLLRQVYGLNPFPESKVIADKLNTLMTPEDKLVVFGTEIQMYFYTNKVSPSRFAGSGALLEFPVKKSESWQKEFIADVEKANPKYLVFYSHPISWMANPKVKNLIFPWFDKFSAEKYNLIGFADMYDNNTNYVWAPDLDMVNNPPKSQYKIFIFERKSTK